MTSRERADCRSRRLVSDTTCCMGLRAAPQNEWGTLPHGNTLTPGEHRLSCSWTIHGVLPPQIGQTCPPESLRLSRKSEQLHVPRLLAAGRPSPALGYPLGIGNRLFSPSLLFSPCTTAIHSPRRERRKNERRSTRWRTLCPRIESRPLPDARKSERKVGTVASTSQQSNLRSGTLPESCK